MRAKNYIKSSEVAENDEKMQENLLKKTESESLEVHIEIEILGFLSEN